MGGHNWSRHFGRSNGLTFLKKYWVLSLDNQGGVSSVEKFPGTCWSPGGLIILIFVYHSITIFLNENKPCMVGTKSKRMVFRNARQWGKKMFKNLFPVVELPRRSVSPFQIEFLYLLKLRWTLKDLLKFSHTVAVWSTKQLFCSSKTCNNQTP